MKKTTRLVILVICMGLGTTSLHAQNSDVAFGGLVGMTSYFGDFNNSSPIYRPGVMLNGIYHKTLSDHYAYRVNFGGGIIRGNPADYNGRLISVLTNAIPQSFSNFFANLDARFEVGFMPYDPFAHHSKLRMTPYFTAGLGALYFNNKQSGFSSDNLPVTITIPMGFGVKYRWSYRTSVAAEWVFKKTFSDGLDGWVNVGRQGFLINNDWVSYIGVYFTYQIFDQDCPSCNKERK